MIALLWVSALAGVDSVVVVALAQAGFRLIAIVVNSVSFSIAWAIATPLLQFSKTTFQK